MHKIKVTYSGKLLEVDIYPVNKAGARLHVRGPKQKSSTAEQERYNRKKAIRKMVRLVNANFNEKDYFLHPTYRPQEAPKDEKAARKDLTDYIRKIRAIRKREAERLRAEIGELQRGNLGRRGQEAISRMQEQAEKLEEPLKYIYVIEKQTYKRGPNAGRDNWHFHLFITGGLPDKTMEALWPHGVRVNCDNYDPERFGPEAAARYMTKDPQGSKRFVPSRNLEKPKERIKNAYISARQEERYATQRAQDPEFWERKHKGYRFLRGYGSPNAYNGHWYTTIVMWKAEGGASPPWDEDDWILMEE